MKIFRTPLPLIAAALLTGALLLFAGCEKEKPQKEETHNPLCGTAWVKKGIFIDTTICEPYYKDTFFFITDTMFLLKGENGPEKYWAYQLTDSLLRFYDETGRLRNSNVWFYIDEHHLVIRKWLNPLTIAWEHKDILLKKIDHEN